MNLKTEKKLVPVIGLEVHIEQNTKSKMFCSCPADHFGAKPNSQICPVCLGLPGALPYINQKAIENIIKFGLVFDCEILEFSKFDRKHYSYPDLPKGYQISQYDLPLCRRGKWKNIAIQRIHMEEDTGKIVHTDVKGKKKSLIDFNRSGVPLMEMVTGADFTEVDEVLDFLREVQLIVRYLGISDADMEKGSMRLEANISMRSIDSKKLPDYKIELKNINSFRFLQKAINEEIKRQSKILLSGAKPVQETRGYDEVKQVTFSQRIKEESADYRYFPEPDLPPVKISRQEIDAINSSLPQTPEEKRKILRKLGLSEQYVETLVADKKRVDFFQKAAGLVQDSEISVSEIANVMVNQNLDHKYQEPGALVKYLHKLHSRQYADAAKTKKAAQEVLLLNEKAVKDYRSGKHQVIGFLIGQVQKNLKGQGDPKLIKTILEKLLMAKGH